MLLLLSHSMKCSLPIHTDRKDVANFPELWYDFRGVRDAGLARTFPLSGLGAVS